jgi:hypothetical protein
MRDKAETVSRENPIRELTVAELDVVSGAGLPGAANPDTCTCNDGVGAGPATIAIGAAGGGK